VAKSLSGAYREKAAEVLRKIAEVARDDEVKYDALGTIEIIGRYGDFITAWHVSGPYAEKGKGKDDLFETVFPPEEAEAGDVLWRVMPSTCNPDKPWLVDLGSALGGNTQAVAYLRTTLLAPEVCEATLEMGSNDAVKTWLNGEMIHANNAARHVQPADDVVAVNLRNGNNTLLLKIVNDGGAWGACARFRDGSGEVEVELGD
jgi:hypothetical protein